MEEYSRRCTTCGISFPDEYRFAKCPRHGEAIDRIQSPHDPDWVDRLAFLVSQDRLNEMDAELIPVIDGHVRLTQGQLWIHSWDVVGSGIKHRLKEGDLVKVGQRVFEILAYTEKTRLYLVQAFETRATDAAIAEMLRV